MLIDALVNLSILLAIPIALWFGMVVMSEIAVGIIDLFRGRD